MVSGVYASLKCKLLYVLSKWLSWIAYKISQTVYHSYGYYHLIGVLSLKNGSFGSRAKNYQILLPDKEERKEMSFFGKYCFSMALNTKTKITKSLKPSLVNTG